MEKEFGKHELLTPAEFACTEIGRLARRSEDIDRVIDVERGEIFKGISVQGAFFSHEMTGRNAYWNPKDRQESAA